MLAGTDTALRNEWLVIGAHFDHLGRSSQDALDPEAGNAIRNGADDDGSGSVEVATGLDDDELIVSVRAPVLGPGWGWSFHEVARRDGDFAMASAAVLIRSADGLIVEARVAVGGLLTAHAACSGVTRVARPARRASPRSGRRSWYCRSMAFIRASAELSPWRAA